MAKPDPKRTRTRKNRFSYSSRVTGRMGFHVDEGDHPFGYFLIKA
jgi:hypothetical protein